VRPPEERARLRELFAEREQLARELDLPPGRLVPNEVLSRLGERAEIDEDQLARLLGTKASPHADRFREALRRARKLKDAPEDEVRSQGGRPISPLELERRKTRKRLLTDLRAKEAALRGVDPQVVLPGHCLNDIVDLPVVDLESLRAVPGFGECRMGRYGERMVAELTASWPR
jgi:ribonuclease D